MSGKITLDIGLNASDVAKGAKDAERALDNLDDAVSDLEKKTAKADGGKEIGDSFRKGAKEGERALDRLEDELKDVQRAADRAGDEGGRGLKKMGPASQEVAQEIGQNMGEAVSSIRGDLSDLGQVGQDTLGGLAATIAGTGPAGIVGAAALAAGAVGLGAVTASLQQQEEEAEKLRDRMSDLYQEAIEDGRTYIDTAQIIAEAQSLMFDPERATEFKRLQDDSRILGMDIGDVIRANSGDMDAQALVQARINDLQDQSLDKREKTLTGATEHDRQLSMVEERWKAIAEATGQNADAAAGYQSFLLGLVGAADSVGVEIDEVGNKLLTLPDGAQIVIDAETGTASDNISKFGDDVDGVIDRISGKEAVAKVKGDTSAADRDFETVEKRTFRDKAVNAKLGSTAEVDNWRPSPRTLWVDVKPRGEYAKGLLG